MKKVLSIILLSAFITSCTAVVITACSDSYEDMTLSTQPECVISQSQMAVEFDAKGSQQYISCNSQSIILATSHALMPAPYQEVDGGWIFDISKREELFEGDLINPIIAAPLNEYVSFDFEWIKVSLGPKLKIECEPNTTASPRTIYLVFGRHYPWIYNNFITITQNGYD